MNILAIDIGTTTGWALSARDGSVKGGSENFAAKRTEGPAQRWLKFRAFLTETARAAGQIDAVYYELVMVHGLRTQPNTLAAHVYGGFEALLQVWCETNRIPLYSVNVAKIKKHWTDKGNANKDAMLAEARRRGFAPVDDNHADALALLSYAQAEEGKPEPLPF
jgi:hypothetical protein